MILLAGMAVVSATRMAVADSFIMDGNKYDCTINGIADGRLSATVRDIPRVYDLADVSMIDIDLTPRFIDAETARGEDARKAAALYKQVISTINKPDLKLLAEWRAIEPTEKDGRWTEAVVLFLDVYQASPDEAIWKGRPTQFPAEGSSMLGESAEKVAAAIKGARSEEAKKNLRGYLLEIYTKAGDVDAAQRLAKEISTGVVEELKPAGAPAAAAETGRVGTDVAGALKEIEGEIRARQFDTAIARADGMLNGKEGAAVEGDAAVQLFLLKSTAYEGKGNLEEATAVLLRIPAHYPSSPAAPAALLRAVEMEKKLGRDDSAKALIREIVEKYPDSKEAALAKAQ